MNEDGHALETAPGGDERNLSGFDDCMTGPERRQGEARILIVEDDEPLLCAFRDTLIRSGFRVDVATTAHAATRLIDLHAYEVVVTDLQLPGHGHSVIDYCSVRMIPTIVVTGRDCEGGREMAIDRGACDYLTKPVDARALRKAIERALR